MRNTKEENAKPGLWPDGETESGLQRSLLYFDSNKMSTHNHLNRFFDFLQIADPVRSLSILSKMYFNYIAKNVNELKEDDLDEFCLLISFIADIAVNENKYVAEDRQTILEELYRTGYYQQPGRGQHEQE